MGLIVRLLLFVSSFSIALLLVGLRLIDRSGGWATLSLVAAGLCVLPAVAIGWYASHGGTFDGTVVSVESSGEAIAGYLATYILPIILVDPADSFDVIAVAAFVVLLSLVYARTDLHYLNPLLPLLGFRVWRVTVQAPDRCHQFVAITRAAELDRKDEVRVVGDGSVRLIKMTRRP